MAKPAVTRCRHRRLGIPRRFHVHGHEVTVRIISPARWPHAKRTVGIYDPGSHRIDLRSDQGETELQQTFCHELVHCLLDSINHKLSYNETFVDNLGSVLAQALASFTHRRSP